MLAHVFPVVRFEADFPAFAGFIFEVKTHIFGWALQVATGARGAAGDEQNTVDRAILHFCGKGIISGIFLIVVQALHNPGCPQHAQGQTRTDVAV